MARRFEVVGKLPPPSEFKRSPTEDDIYVDPYDAPLASTKLAPPSKLRNPAKPLMLLIGGLYAAFSPMAFLAGVQAGLHVIAGSALMLVLGCGTIWLALRTFTPLYRIATIIWGSCLVAFFGFAAFSAYEPADIGGTIFFGFVLLVVAPIPILAIGQSPHRVGDGDA